VESKSERIFEYQMDIRFSSTDEKSNPVLQSNITCKPTVMALSAISGLFHLVALYNRGASSTFLFSVLTTELVGEFLIDFNVTLKSIRLSTKRVKSNSGFHWNTGSNQCKTSCRKIGRF